METIVNKFYMRFNCYQNKYSEMLLILSSTAFINISFSLLQRKPSQSFIMLNNVLFNNIQNNITNITYKFVRKKWEK